jgi:site-specific recombinase XerD
MDIADTEPTFEAAGKAYLEAHERAGSSPSTQKKYRLLWAKMAQFATDKRGYTNLKQWKRADVTSFLDWMGGAPKTHRTNWANLKAAFEYCVGREWMPVNVARFKEIRNLQAREAAKVGQRFPFTDAELERMLDVCEHEYDYRPVQWSRKIHARRNIDSTDYTRYKRTWKGKDLADFILLSVYTGLRISDVATFHIDRLQENGDVRVRARKNGTWVCTWVPPWLAQIIRDRAAKHGPYIFGTHTTTDMDVITDVWRRKLKIMWKLCGEWTMPPTHHRLRHTFVRMLLVRGVSVPMIAELAGDTERMIRVNYSAWVPERQDQVRSALQVAFADAPKAANVVPIKK